MKKIAYMLCLVCLILAGCGAPTEVENAVDEANLDCPINLYVAKVESVSIEDKDIVYTLSVGQIVRNVILNAPDQAKVAIIGMLKSTAGAGFNKVTKAAEDYQYNIVIRVEDEKEDYDPIDITATPEEIAKIDTGNLQLNLFR